MKRRRKEEKAPEIVVQPSRKPCYVKDRIDPRTPTQKAYFRSIDENLVTFGIGPAGTGKTFIAAYLAAMYLSQGKVDKIVLCRPAVEAGGEELGFLPGDIREKMDPYLRPAFDALERFLGRNKVVPMMDAGIVEIAPLAFMRGRTFENCFVIADEMQNATEEQVKMLLTRFGEGSKMVINGDPGQRDLQISRGLETATRLLQNAPDIGFVQFGTADVVRHRLVRDVLDRWV